MTANGSRKTDATGRTTGVRKKGKFGRIIGQWAPRRIEMLESPSYRALSLSARRLLDCLEIELARHGGRENGDLPCTYQDLIDYGIDRHAIAPAIREAVALGFIEYLPGRGGNSEFRTPNKFRLTFRETDSAFPTDEWRRVGSIQEAETLARSARKSPSKGRSSKQKTDGGFYQVSMGETPTR